MPIITCPNCGAKNRVEDRGGNLQPVCGKCHQPLPLSASTPSDGAVIELTDATLQSTLASAAGKPILVDTWAPWCGPCRMIAPIVEQLAKESQGKYLVGKLNIDENPRTASQYQIDSIPTLLIFKNNQLVDRVVGLQPKPAIQQRLQRVA
jgi:thioredoxin 2